MNIPPSQPPKILIMDDEEFIRDVASLMLKRLGLAMEFAKDSPEALDAVRHGQETQYPCSVAILDLTIPGGMGGLDVLPLLRKIDPSIKAIASSGYSNDPVMSDPKRFGFDATLIKPYQKIELVKVLESVLQTSLA